MIESTASADASVEAQALKLYDMKHYKLLVLAIHVHVAGRGLANCSDGRPGVKPM